MKKNKKIEKSNMIENIEFIIFKIVPIIISISIGLLIMLISCSDEFYYKSHSFSEKFWMVVPLGLIIGGVIMKPILFIFLLLEEIYSYIKNIIMKIISKNKFKLYMNKFKNIEIKNKTNINLIKEIKSEDLEIEYIYMDNDDKYNYYKRKDTENLLEKINEKTNIVYNLTNETINKNISKAFNNVDYKQINSSDELNTLKELIKLSKMLVINYNKIYNEYKMDMIGISIGKQGEDLVNKNIEMYNHKLMNIRNTRFEIDGQSVETDNLILSKNGIFSLEVKNLGATGKYDIRVDKDGKWNKIEKNKVLEMPNVTSQTYRHTALTEKLFIKELNKLGINKEITVHPLIVLANDKVLLDNQSDIKIIRTSNIYKEICNQNDNLSEELLQSLKQIILDNNLPAKSYQTINIVKSAETIDKLLDISLDLLIKYNNLLEEIIN